MSAIIICDGCGLRAPMESGGVGNSQWFKPRSWFERSDEDGIQSACSRECIDKIATKTGKTRVIIPI